MDLLFHKRVDLNEIVKQSKYDNERVDVESHAAAFHRSNVDDSHASARRLIGTLKKQATLLYSPSSKDLVLFEEDKEVKEPVKTKPFFLVVFWLMRRLWKNYGKQIIEKQTIVANLCLSAIASVLWFNLGYTEPAIFLKVALCFWLAGSKF